MTHEQMTTIKEFAEMLTKQVDKINKKGDITPDELIRMDKAIDILKDIQIMCAMEEYGNNPEEEMYSSMGYYGRNSRAMYQPMPQPLYSAENYSGVGRNSMGRFTSRGYSRDDAAHKMRSDLEMKLSNATDEHEREAILKCLRALD